jgi:F-type H+-transporting ATPase subunit delta
MATQDRISYRYAKALFDYLKASPEAEGVLADMQRFSTVVAKNSELKFLVSTPAFGAKERRAVVDEVVTRMKLKEPSRRILVTLSDLKQLGSLARIVTRMMELFLNQQQTVLLNVKAADELSDTVKGNIESKFGKILGKRVQAHYEIDPKLIGGLRVVAGGRTYDGSVAGWLTSFEESLAGGHR